ncbi:MAG: PilZ domain-containing protein [Bradyrhizobium sp.]
MPIAHVYVKRVGEAGPVDEKRRHPRTEVNEPGYVSSGGSVMHCTIVNISPEGAAIEVENSAFVPHRFRLVMARDASVVHECQVIWSKKTRIGVSFVKPA